MTALELLKDIEAAGLKISALEGNLKLEGATRSISPQLVDAIREHKAMLLDYLQRQAARFPLTPLQQAYYRGRSPLFDGGEIANQVFHEIEGVWDIERLQQALQQVISEHSALRLRITSDGEQYESDDIPSIIRHDLRTLSTSEQVQVRENLRTEKSHLILSPSESLLQVDVAILSDDSMVLYVNHDGMVVDGISMFLFFHHWYQHYQTVLEPVTYLPFSQHISVKEKEREHAAYKRSRDYWLQRLPTLPKAPELPLASKPHNGAIRFCQHLVTLAPQQWQQLQKLMLVYQLTPAVALMAAYAETLYVWGAGEHFTLNVTISERRPIHPQAFSTIGPFSDPMLAEISLDHQSSFLERAKQLQSRLHQDIDHRYFSGIDVMQELARKRGLSAARMSYTFNCTLGAVGAVNGDSLEYFGREVFTISQTPQVLLDAFIFEQKGALVIRLDGVDAYYPSGFLTVLVSGFQLLLHLLCVPENWQQSVFELLPDEQRHQRALANNTQMPCTEDMLGSAFVAVALRQPESIAIHTLQRQISYGELLNRAATAAQWLKARGVKHNELVGLIAERSPEHIVGILAIVLAGAAYLPIDAGLPAERRDFMLKDGQVNLVLTNVDVVTEQLQFDLRTCSQIPAELPSIDPLACPDDLAYVLYTSGTTGNPKGVMVTHRNVINLIADCQSRFTVTPEDRFFAISAFNFDLSVWDLFGALSAGASLVIPEADKAADVEHWATLCRETGVTIWNSVPAIVRMMYEHTQTMPSSLRLIMMSGDRIPPDLPAAIISTQPQIDLWSLGGPTETTIWNICHPISLQDCTGESIPYGRPNSNNQCSIRNEQGLECPDWVPGEIYATGIGITLGYWRDEARTSERYLIDPKSGKRFFRTGDLGRYLPNGDVDILGRVDLQIKVNGYRIETGEIESSIAKFAEIGQVAVVASKSSQGDVLVAHLVANDEPLPSAEIRQRLSQHLPDYMIPARVVWHDALPLNRNLKIDRKALGELPLDEGNSASSLVSQANGRIESTLQGIWQEILAAGSIGVDEDFFDRGGNSLSALRILTSVRKTFGISMPLESIYHLNTVKAMAARIASEEAQP
ncbi:amino acid adenylation domain-containing protein [Xenorhabdus bovienii]|uniref:non-ribosomal peptide synthetase n=1 Tax=Xenorhabdus bovienii TaxID=40576 RepID=UPI0023B2C4E2|nr:amino acid adenylation domain-containing protein [Xenorhabdus bovienii]MDE9565816.1 amino acid adenylation domain-containing protein [Xenorhabdus bovienii]